MSFLNPLNDRDLELLSSYLDGELTAAERSQLETRLVTDPELRRELNSLRQTVALIQQSAPIRAPRDFTLTPAMVRPSRINQRILFFQSTTTFSALSAAAAFVLILAGVLLLNSGPSLGPGIRSESALITRTAVETQVAALSTDLPAEAQVTALSLPSVAARVQPTLADMMFEFAADDNAVANNAAADEDGVIDEDDGADALFPPDDVNVGRGSVQDAGAGGAGGGSGDGAALVPPAPAPGSADLFAESEGLADMVAPSSAMPALPTDLTLVEEQEAGQDGSSAEDQADDQAGAFTRSAMPDAADESESAAESFMTESLAVQEAQDVPGEGEPPLAALAQVQVPTETPTEITLLPPTDTPSPTATAAPTNTPTPTITPPSTLTTAPTGAATDAPAGAPGSLPAQASPVDSQTNALGIGLIVVGLVVAGIAIGAFIGRRR